MNNLNDFTSNRVFTDTTANHSHPSQTHRNLFMFHLFFNEQDAGQAGRDEATYSHGVLIFGRMLHTQMVKDNRWR